MPDLRVHVTTFRAGSGGRGNTYPVSTAKLSGAKLAFDVAPGRANCITREGATGNSVSGNFRCEFKGTDRLVCATGWEGWEPIEETYTRR